MIHRAAKRKRNIFTPLFYYIILVLVGILVIVPFLWVIGNSFKGRTELNRFTELGLYTFLPESFVLDNYRRLFSSEEVQISFLKVFYNTVCVGVVAVAVNLFVNSLAAYSFARIKFFARNTVFLLILFLLIIPADILLLPQYKLIKDMGLLDTLTAVVLPAVANPFMIFFLRQFFLEIPKDLEDAATIDGCGRWRIFYRVMLPLVKGPVFTVSILVFLTQWDNYIWPTTIISGLDKYVLQMAIAFLAIAQYETDFGAMYAGAVLSIIPIILLFISIQKHYVENMATSGIKG